MSESSSQQRPTARRLVRAMPDGEPATANRPRRFAEVLALHPGAAGSPAGGIASAPGAAAPPKGQGTATAAPGAAPGALAVVRSPAPQRAMDRQARAGGPLAGHAPATESERARELREEQRHVTAIVRLVGQAAFESMAGLRPVHQLARWLAPEPFEKLRLRVELCRACTPEAGNRHYRSTVVRRSRVCRVGDRAYEASLVVADQKRVRAAALRIEQRRGQWQVQVIEIG